MFEEIQGLWHNQNPERAVNILMSGHSFCDKTYDIARKDCEFMQIEYIYDGYGTLEVNGETYHPKKNDIYITPATGSYRYYSSGDNPWNKIWVTFDGPLALGMAAQHLPSDLYLVEDCDISTYMEDILNITKVYSDDYDRLCDEVTVFLLKIMIQIKNHMNNKVERLPERIRSMLDRSVEESLSLDDICAQVSYTKNHIIKVFKDFYGKTPYTYYREKKIEVAKRYLDNTNLSIGEIAERLNFADGQYFSGCFKELTGMTPSKYRKRK